MNADGICQIPLTAINAELASVPRQSDIAKNIYIYFSAKSIFFYRSFCIT